MNVHAKGFWIFFVAFVISFVTAVEVTADQNDAPLLVLKTEEGCLEVRGDIRERLGERGLIVNGLELVDCSTKKRLKITDELNSESGFNWPNQRVVLEKGKLRVFKVDPIQLPGNKTKWFDYKEREIYFDKDGLVAFSEKLVFKVPKLSQEQIKKIKSDYQRLMRAGSAADLKEVEILMGQVFTWALQEAHEGVAALKSLRKDFSLDGAYSEQEALYEKMLEEVEARASR